MNIRKLSKIFIILCIFLYSSLSFSQSLTSDLDKDYLDSLPESVQEDVLSEIEKQKKDQDKNLQKRPSTKLMKNRVVQDWEEYKRKKELDSSERYGIKLFNTMQTSFMPLNEPNFGNNYIVDYGDFITLSTFGDGNNEIYELEIGRDGTILIPEIGSISVAGLNFEEVTNLIKTKYKNSFIGTDIYVSLSEIRDINVLITGNVEFPGIYTLSGNSNILQALNIVGGISENGSLRNIVLKRKGMPDQVIDLYKALIFGDLNNIPSLMSGDSINVNSVTNLVRAGYGFNNVATFELKEGETINDLIKYAGGLKSEASSDTLKLVRFENSEFVSYNIDFKNINEYEIKNLDSIYAYKEKVGTVTISGYVQYPGKYSISSSDRTLNIIQRAGGYLESGYPFGASLFRESTKVLEKNFADKTYQNLISYIAANPASIVGGGGDSFAYILNELKNYEPSGRYIAEFDIQNLKDDIQNNIYLNDGDKIHIPSFTSNVFVFGEVGNPGSVLFKDQKTLKDYIQTSGGLTRLASSDYIFIVSPNGETTRVATDGILSFINFDINIYPGSVIYVPRHIGKVEGINLVATIAPIFSSLALSIASLNSIND
mgnify:CR=1 FL=1